MNERRTQVSPFREQLRWLKQSLGENYDLIFEFFMVFSRFEYALKQVGFRNNDRGYLMPDWRRFSAKVNERFDPGKTPQLRCAFDYYLSHPPRIQVLENGKLGWKQNQKKCSKETDLAWVIGCIRIVRNNLFHGGKFPWDLNRDVKLLSFGLIILNEILELDERVKNVFYS